jgi:hypothetical protein
MFKSLWYENPEVPRSYIMRTLRFLVSYVCVLCSIMYGRDYACSWVPIATIRYALEGERARLYASDNIRYELGMSCGMLVILSLATTVDLIHTSRVMYAHTAHIAQGRWEDWEGSKSWSGGREELMFSKNTEFELGCESLPT